MEALLDEIPVCDVVSFILGNATSGQGQASCAMAHGAVFSSTECGQTFAFHD